MRSDDRLWAEKNLRQKDIQSEFIKDIGKIVDKASFYKLHVVVMMASPLEESHETSNQFGWASRGYASHYLQYLDVHDMGGANFQEMVRGDSKYRDVVAVSTGTKRPAAEDIEYRGSSAEVKRARLREQVPREVLDKICETMTRKREFLASPNRCLRGGTTRIEDLQPSSAEVHKSGPQQVSHRSPRPRIEDERYPRHPRL